MYLSFKAKKHWLIFQMMMVCMDLNTLQKPGRVQLQLAAKVIPTLGQN